MPRQIAQQSANISTQPLSLYTAAQMSGSSLPHVGAAALVNRTTLAAAQALCEEYLAAAGEPDGRKFYFGQVTACK